MSDIGTRFDDKCILACGLFSVGVEMGFTVGIENNSLYFKLLFSCQNKI